MQCLRSASQSHPPRPVFMDGSSFRERRSLFSGSPVRIVGSHQKASLSALKTTLI